MTRLVAFYQSSIGKKITMSLTGLFLCSFLIVHLVGNLLLLKQDGGAAFDAYSAFMSTNGAIRLLEIGLALSIVAHIISGVTVWWQNRQARPAKYDTYRLKDTTPIWARYAWATGGIVFVFLAIHLQTFVGGLRFVDEKPSAYALVAQAFSSAWYSAWYVAALVLLGYHLRHGFQSGFQTLGLRNKRYTGLIDAVAVFFWLIVPIGFAVIPIYFYFFHNVAVATMVAGGQ
jgi:succinate dehydrogenase / fumarate reductase cytochrome b subunit